MYLRGRPNNREICIFHQKHVGRWIDRAQGAVEINWAGFEFLFKALR